MKLQFTHQGYQSSAVSAVVDLFRGQVLGARSDSVVAGAVGFDTVCNGVVVRGDVLRGNLHDVQRRNGLALSGDDDAADLRFCVEMETGTGKTFVYTQTIYELHREFGLSKFIVVVPSVAIREGVQKSFEVTHEHFQRLYDNQPIRWFVYSAARLNDLFNFAHESDGIEVMIINIAAFDKDKNVINQVLDRMYGAGRPIDLIRGTNPVVIIDEPQSVDSTEKAREAIASLNPAFVLRYSATHRERINPVYRLTPVDAYREGLVKQIAVSSIRSMDDFNQPFVRLVSVDNSKGFRARVELDVLGKDGKVKRKEKLVRSGCSLFAESGEREMYRDYAVTDIDCTPGFEKIELNGAQVLHTGQSIGGIADIEFKRAQIARTVELHLDKELRLLPAGIKVLSLFFIDRVDRYRQYAGDGAAMKGEYAQIFEQEYARLIALPRYAGLAQLLPAAADAAAAHDGYFSMDKQKHASNTRGDTAADEKTYELIMRDKERLLAVETRLRFIFSHSALKEGWDNPNVFQVCTLLEQSSALTCRQKIGRGLRLCVNSAGERVHDKQRNLLHVVASESFAEFAQSLQSEIEQETGYKFGILDIACLQDWELPRAAAEAAGLELEPEPEAREEEIEYGAATSAELKPADVPQWQPPAAKPTAKLTHAGAQRMFDVLRRNEVIDSRGVVSRKARIDVVAGTLELPVELAPIADLLIEKVRSVLPQVVVRDDSKRVAVRLKKEVLLSPEFLEIWDRIKQKTLYRVQMDLDKFVEGAAKLVREMPPISKARLESSTAMVHVKNEGVIAEETQSRTVEVAAQSVRLPNVLFELQDRTHLDLPTVFEILKRSERIADFANNPESFLEQVTEVLRRVKSEMGKDGIRYEKIAGQEYALQEVFDKDELIGYLDSTRGAVAVANSVFDHVMYESAVERRFAEALDRDCDVKMFFKLPDNFKVDTPIGPYNPDWAVLLERDDEQRLYFVLETKGSVDWLQLRGDEQIKITCGKRHFEALDNVTYRTVVSLDQLHAALN